MQTERTFVRNLLAVNMMAGHLQTPSISCWMTGRELYSGARFFSFNSHRFLFWSRLLASSSESVLLLAPHPSWHESNPGLGSKLYRHIFRLCGSLLTKRPLDRRSNKSLLVLRSDPAHGAAAAYQLVVGVNLGPNNSLKRPLVS